MHFIVRSDHSSLQWLKKSDKGRLSRWAVIASEFDFTIKHKPGKNIPHADALSRYPILEADPDWDPIPEYVDPGIFVVEQRPQKQNLHVLVMQLSDYQTQIPIDLKTWSDQLKQPTQISIMSYTTRSP